MFTETHRASRRSVETFSGSCPNRSDLDDLRVVPIRTRSRSTKKKKKFPWWVLTHFNRHQGFLDNWSVYRLCVSRIRNVLNILEHSLLIPTDPLPSRSTRHTKPRSRKEETRNQSSICTVIRPCLLGFQGRSMFKRTYIHCLMNGWTPNLSFPK